jgi:WD40 repeat protein
LAVLLVTFVGLLVALVVAPHQRPPSAEKPEQPAASARVSPPEVAPQPRVLRWPVPGTPGPGLPDEPDALKWVPAAVGIPAGEVVGWSGYGLWGAPTATRLLSFSQDGSRLVVATAAFPTEKQDDHHIFDTATGCYLGPLTKVPQAEFGFAPDGSVLLTTGDDYLALHDGNTAKWMSAPSSEAVRFGRGCVRYPTFSPDGKRVAFGGNALTIVDFACTPVTAPQRSNTWPAPNTHDLKLTPLPRQPEEWGTVRAGHIQWSADGSRLAAQLAATVNVYAVSTGKRLCQIPIDSRAEWPPPQGPTSTFHLSPDGKRLTTAELERGTALVWDVDTQTPLSVSKLPDAFKERRWVVSSADGSRLAGLVPDEHTAALVTDPTGRAVRTIRLAGSAGALLLSGDGRRLAALTEGGAITIYDTGSGAPVCRLQDGRAPVFHLAYRAGGKVVRATHVDGTIREWDADTYRPLRATRMELAKDEHILAVSPDGRLWATATTKGACRVRDVERGKPRMQPAEQLFVPMTESYFDGNPRRPPPPPPHPDLGAVLLSFASDSRHLVGQTGDGETITVWDVETGRTAHTVATSQRASRLTLSPDATVLFALVPARPEEPYSSAQSQSIWAHDLKSGAVARVADLGYPPYRSESSGTLVHAIFPLGRGDALGVVLRERTYPSEPGSRDGPADTHYAWIVRRTAREDGPTQFQPNGGPDVFRLEYQRYGPDGEWTTADWPLSLFTTHLRYGLPPDGSAQDPAPMALRPNGRQMVSGKAGEIVFCDLETWRRRVKAELK